MNFRLPCKCLLAVALIVLTGSCVTHRTVTKDGKKVRSGYVVKKPFDKPGN
jgi:hypothetical protein